MILLVAVLLSAGGGYVTMRIRYVRLRDKAEGQIRAVVAVESNALARQDLALFLEQQDENAPEWYARQAAVAQRTLGTSTSGQSRTPQGRPLDPPSVQDIELRGDVAWVEVTEGDPLVRRARFYRRTASGWKQTAPQTAFWGQKKQIERDKVIVRYYQRDEPFVLALLGVLEEVSATVSADLKYNLAGRVVIIEFTPDLIDAGRSSVDSASSVSAYRREIRMPPLWISGIPADGVWDLDTLVQLKYEIAHELALNAVRSASRRDLDPLQRALADEYAAWVSHSRDASQAPLLHRIVERHGSEAVPMVFLTLRSSRLSALFVAQWLSLYPAGDAVGFFDLLMMVEREALLAGRKETFLMLQSPAGRRNAEQWYEANRTRDMPGAPPQAHVEQVEIVDAWAFVTLREPHLRWDAPQRCALVPYETLQDGTPGGEVGRVVRMVGSYGLACPEGEWWDWMRTRRASAPRT